MKEQYVKLKEVLKMVEKSFVFLTFTNQKAKAGYETCLNRIKSLQTIEIDQPEFKVGDEVYVNSSIVKPPLGGKIIEIILKKETTWISISTGFGIRKVIPDLVFKTEQDAEQALKELKEKDK